MSGKFPGTPYQGQTRAQLLALPVEQWVTALEDGCDVAERCTRCPLRRCRFDDPRWFARARRYARDHTILQVLEGNGRNYELTARQLDIDVRTVYLAQKRVYQRHDTVTDEELAALTPIVRTDESSSYNKVRFPRHLALL